jgi:hypothetical protein
LAYVIELVGGSHVTLNACQLLFTRSLPVHSARREYRRGLSKPARLAVSHDCEIRRTLDVAAFFGSPGRPASDYVAIGSWAMIKSPGLNGA